MANPVIRDVPKLRIANRKKRFRQPRHDPSDSYNLRYRSKKHPELPHVVKFSSGRTSAMLLFVLLENRLLDASRGDVIVFNNTSAEHPSTYEFVRACMGKSEAYGIPFFQVEFQTYEDARQGEWVRLPSYRLVNTSPHSDSNPDGFHWRGEAFEEMLSWAGYVPNQFSRNCTQKLKLEVTRQFLKDWFASKPGIPRLGHYGQEPRINPESSYRQHRKNSGGVPKDVFCSKREYVWKNRPFVRPEQRYDQFCAGWKPFENAALRGSVFGGKAKFSRGGVEYVSLIGLRSDEPERVQRIKNRESSEAGYEGEYVYMPLSEMQIARADVNDFWQRQDWDLDMPGDTRLSNCVYCFLKGAANLNAIHKEMRPQMNGGAWRNLPGSLQGTPSDLRWWVDIEKKYGRDLVAENRVIKSEGRGEDAVDHIGFFGNHKFSYEKVDQDEVVEGLKESMLPCDCTE